MCKHWGCDEAMKWKLPHAVGRPPKDVELARKGWLCPNCEDWGPPKPNDPDRMTIKDIKYDEQHFAKDVSAKPAKSRLTGTKRSGDLAASKSKVPKPTASEPKVHKLDSSPASPWLSRMSAVEGHLQGLLDNVGEFGDDSCVEERLSAIEQQLKELVAKKGDSGGDRVMAQYGLTEDSTKVINETKTASNALSATIQNDLRPEMEDLKKELEGAEQRQAEMEAERTRMEEANAERKRRLAELQGEPVEKEKEKKEKTDPAPAAEAKPRPRKRARPQ